MVVVLFCFRLAYIDFSLFKRARLGRYNFLRSRFAPFCSLVRFRVHRFGLFSLFIVGFAVVFQWQVFDFYFLFSIPA